MVNRQRESGTGQIKRGVTGWQKENEGEVEAIEREERKSETMKKERCSKRGERVIQCPPFAEVAMGTPISPWELTSEFHNPLASCLDWNTINTHANPYTNKQIY